MKRVVSLVLSVLLLLSTLFAVVGCGLFGGDKDDENGQNAGYTIQYMDDSGIHKITVQKGDIYTLDVIPEKSGYVFLGLFSAESGGTQYVSASGQAVAPFNDDRNVVLYPQFKTKEYKLILDYQGAAVTGSRSIAVDYDSAIRELPMNLSLENKVFTGWYTEPDRKGTQIADRYGILPENELVTEKTFDLSDPEGKIRLYAGFEGVKYTVTFYSEDNAAPEEIKVEHGTNIADVVPSARVNGQAVLVWSKTKNDTARENVFTGKVTGDMVLYAVEYAPVIDFDANGGDDVVSLVAKAGDPITLPTPTRKNYKFAEWQDPQGNAYTATTMPTKGLTLKAVWQAMLVFDENGGSDVNDISVPAGQAITLPIPEKDGFLFAGWYTADKEQYTSTRMPAASVKLKAGWYKAKTTKITLIENSVDAKKTSDSKTLTGNNRIKIDLSEIIPTIPSEGIEITYTVHFRWGNTTKQCSAKGVVALYEGIEFNSSHELCRKALSHSSTAYDTYLSDTLSGTSIIHDKILYFYYDGGGDLHISLSGGYGTDAAFYDVYLELIYPASMNLYL